MNGKAHLATGLAAGAAYAGASGQPLALVAPCALASGVAALMPDLDKDNALLSSWLPWLSWLVRRVSCGHRGLTHLVPLWIGVAALCCYQLAPPAVGWPHALVVALCGGYLVHLAQDAMTKDGIPLIPVVWTHWHITPCRWLHFRSDSLMASAVTVVMVVGCLGVVALAYVPGALPWFDAGIRTVAGAR